MTSIAQQDRTNSVFNNGKFYKLSADQKLAELSKVLGLDEATRLLGEAKAQKITLDSVRLLGAQAQTEHSKDPLRAV